LISELRRIRDLPRPSYDRHAWGSVLGRSGAELRPAQLACLDAAWYAATAGVGPDGPRGVAGLLGCGHGKTLVAQLLPVVFDAARPLLLIPASLVGQLHRDVLTWRGSFHLAVPPHITYERLGHPNHQNVLAEAAPDLVILDEAHLLASTDSARWRRLARYLAAHPEARVCLLSGTLTWRTLRQMRHLLTACLRDWAPLPSDRSIEHLSAVVDIGGIPQGSDWWHVRDLLGEVHTTQRAREALHERIASAPGVVYAAGVAADVSLTLREVEPTLPRPPDLVEADALLERRWELPDGTQLVDGLEIDRARRSISLGYYQRWVPTSRDDAWVAARRAWGRAVRTVLTYVRPDLDSPALVAAAVERGELRPFAGAYTEWLEAQKRPAPPTEVVWIARDWALAVIRAALPDEGLGWYTGRAVGTLGVDLGLPVHGLGSEPPTARLALASVAVHGKGWNGQAYHTQTVLQVPPGGGTWEQLLARTHRPGQTQDVHVDVLLPTVSAVTTLRAAQADAKYAAAVLGCPQRLTIGRWIGGDQ
jgi:hypothetical protein